MEYEVRPTVLSGFGAAEMVFIGGRRVGMVYRDPNPPAELAELWIAYTTGGQAVENREDGIQHILQHAAENPTFELL
ncbi:hypothetical protein [Jiangella alkaliphila]|uniref:Uncharacterized protein n=1 Tax=Jiangella alkaliphila TaxID=419479 RepID=A0A1H2GEQ6_9ACTN|nr:hypothetical protein [Jiangella alkaliphila]SDU17901.1 hypothetical protein SAMN04488563_0449 [Jiangella alkaliphila]